jgi:hypothetical protein
MTTMPRNHTHNLDCISATSSTDPKLRGRLWFCKVLGQHLEGPDPNAELRRRTDHMLKHTDERLREIAARHGLDLATATEHAKRIYEEGNPNPLQRSSGKRPLEKHHPAVLEAWEELPGTYSYYSAASAMKQALGGKR